jgi:hypothetical protein
MKFILVTLGTFLLCMFFINLKAYLKSPKYNRWINGKVDNVDVGGEEEIWTVKWIAPPSLREKNPEGEQHYYFKFKHGKTFNNIEERRNYINDKSFKNTGNKFFLSIRVDNEGIIRDINKYDGYMAKVIGYGISLVVLAGLIIWFY